MHTWKISVSFSALWSVRECFCHEATGDVFFEIIKQWGNVAAKLTSWEMYVLSSSSQNSQLYFPTSLGQRMDQCFISHFSNKQETYPGIVMT